MQAVLVSHCRFALRHEFSSQGPGGGVLRGGVGAPSTLSDISWEVAGGKFGSIFFSRNFDNLCLLRLILDGGTFFFGFSRVFSVGVP
jgi:hypothetical protein